MLQFSRTLRLTTPPPSTSIQPVCLHRGQPLPWHSKQLTSTSTLGSVKGEVGGTQAGAGVGTEHLLHEGVQSALQIAQRDALIHDQTFHLVEHGAVGSVGVRAEDAARDEHLDGRLLAVHGADLAAGSLGTQQELIGQVEGVLHIAGRDGPSGRSGG